MKTFTLTEQHLKLLKRANVYWEDAESGAPAIDPKRPYGNSAAIIDVLEILGIEPANRCRNCGNDYSLEQEQMADRLHRETETALEIVLATQSFTTGKYAQQSYGAWTYHGRDEEGAP